jgi:hypothetical protein
VGLHFSGNCTWQERLVFLKIKQHYMKQCLLIFLSVLLFACDQKTESAKMTASHNDATSSDTISCPPGSSKLDIQKIEQLTGMKGVEKNGQYKITVPQNDLHVVADGFKIIPPMGLGSWTAFTSCGDSAMIMGDIIVTETDLAPVQQEVIRQGLMITAIHNHFVRNHPDILYMHIDGRGTVDKLSANVKAVFEKVKTRKKLKRIALLIQLIFRSWTRS